MPSQGPETQNLELRSASEPFFPDKPVPVKRQVGGVGREGTDPLNIGCEMDRAKPRGIQEEEPPFPDPRKEAVYDQRGHPSSRCGG